MGHSFISYPIGTCEHPFHNQSVGSSLYILDYSDPAVIGTTVFFTCSNPKDLLIGPNTSTCMEDGQWAPDIIMATRT